MEGYGESGSGKQARKCSEKVASVCQWALLLFGDQYIDSYLVWSLPPFIPFFLLSFFLLSPGLLHSFCFTVGFCVGTVGWKCIIFQILKDIPRMTSLAHLFQQKPVQEVSIALACGVRALGPLGSVICCVGLGLGRKMPVNVAWKGLVVVAVCLVINKKPCIFWMVHVSIKCSALLKGFICSCGIWLNTLSFLKIINIVIKICNIRELD